MNTPKGPTYCGAFGGVLQHSINNAAEKHTDTLLAKTPVAMQLNVLLEFTT